MKAQQIDGQHAQHSMGKQQWQHCSEAFGTEGGGSNTKETGGVIGSARGAEADMAAVA